MRRFQTICWSRPLVARDRRGVRIDRGLNPDALGVGRGTHRIERSLEHRAHIDGLELESHLAARDPREIEKVIDQLHLHVGIADDGVLRAVGELSILGGRGLQNPRPAVHRVERRAKLVRQHGEEFFLGAIGGLGRLAGLTFLAQEVLAFRLAAIERLGGAFQRRADVTDFLDRRLRRFGRRAPADRLGRRSEGRHRPIDAARHPHRPDRAEPDGEQDTTSVDGERTIRRGVHECRWNPQHGDPAARREPAVRREDPFAFERVRDAKPFGAAAVRRRPARFRTTGRRGSPRARAIAPRGARWHRRWKSPSRPEPPGE